MNRLDPDIVDYYDREVVGMISEKYGMDHMTAYLDFVKSETHRMLENRDMDMIQFGAPAIFEIWECEKETGDPRNSSYVRFC